MNPTGPNPAAIPAPTTAATRTSPWLPGALAVLWGLPGLGLLGYAVHTLAQLLGGSDERGEITGEGQVSLLLVMLFTAAVAVPALILGTLGTVACVRLRRGRPGSDGMVFAVGLASVVGALGAAGWTNWWPYHGWIQAVLIAAGLVGAIAAATARPSRRTPATR
ncbi:hypothetical protein OG689_19130 [Kitasatospora sp. NBC_00240]|uniref:hypothetical protein n=1 Tax=Kitasatospora sp. NBC_00240 TaxID=2903567 RepID=UPI0022533072|nr:hypothetical protein [Kitasatospora sp. NBC_00240]MCX5211380.1 hypothetical protein [Kitasatospora sp. NBC_00240]